MRTKQEIDQEYTETVVKIGDIEAKATLAKNRYLARVLELQAEADALADAIKVPTEPPKAE